jgi:hypothetical protein
MKRSRIYCQRLEVRHSSRSARNATLFSVQRMTMLLVLMVCCSAATALADGVGVPGTSENTQLLPLPYSDTLRQINLFLDGAEDPFAWVKGAEVSAIDRTVLESDEEVEEEDADFEPTFVIPGRTLMGEMQDWAALQQWGISLQQNVLSLGSWVSEQSVVLGTVLPVFPPTFPPMAVTVPWASEGTLAGTTTMQPSPAISLQLSPEMEAAVNQALQWAMSRLVQLTNVDPNQLNEYVYSVPFMKFGSQPIQQNALEIPPFSVRLAAWKEWMLDDYGTAFRYISQHFAQFDWESFLAKIQEGDSAGEDSFYMELLLKDLN